MKIYIYILSSLLVFGCKAQKKGYEFNLLNDMFETFNYSEFERQNKKYQGIDKDGFEEEFTFDDGTKVLADNEEMFVLPKKDFYVGYKAFYKNGNIKEKGHYFGLFELNVKSIKIGKWYYFDEKGNLIRTVDEELKFGNFSSQDILIFLQNKKYINLREEVKINDIKKYKDIIPNFEESYPFLSNNSSYQTFQGKTSTEEERKAFEQEQWEKYQARRDKKCLDQNRMNLENIKK